MLLPIIKKEFLLVGRDIHAVAVLFLMPMVFILIMSLSLQDTFEEDSSKIIEIGFIFNNPEDKSTNVGEILLTQSDLKTVIYAPGTSIKKTMIKDELSAMVLVPEEFIQNLINTSLTNKALSKNSDDLLQLYYSPSAPQYLRKLVYAAINQKIIEIKISKLLRDTAPAFEQEKLSNKNIINENELYTKRLKQPSSVEQTVPAWLIFSMFFVVIPISTTFIIEKQFGTLQRLRTMPVPYTYILIGKLIPYLLINLVQTLLMFLVGIYLLPFIGGQGITLGSNAWLLLPMTFSVSILAISFALLIATLVKTTEQATTIGGLSNIILGAIGGIMVPTFVMPEMMQSFARLSPMNWGLEGFLEIILREGSLTSIAPFMIKLLVFGVVFFIMALLIYQRTGDQK